MIKIKTTRGLAFVLVDLAIVILIIGILGITVIGAKQIIRNAKLSSARSLTLDSPVASSPNILLWLESTLKQSFNNNERFDGKKISAWHGIDFFNKSNSATQTILNHQPTFVEYGINDLPVVRFPKSNNKYLNFNGSSLANSNYTVIFVEQRNGDHNYNYFLCGTNTSGSNVNLFLGYFFDTSIIWGQYANDYKFVGIPAYDNKISIPRIHTFRFNPIIGKDYYLNGVNQNLVAINSPIESQGLISFQGAAIGCNPEIGNPSYVGDIAEVIILNIAVKDSERIAIENYLKTKWGIR